MQRRQARNRRYIRGKEERREEVEGEIDVRAVEMDVRVIAVVRAVKAAMIASKQPTGVKKKRKGERKRGE